MLRADAGWWSFWQREGRFARDCHFHEVAFFLSREGGEAIGAELGV